MLQERRRALHTRIVDAIEALYPERLTEHIERLARHAVRGELWEKAVGYLHQAGRKALARSANPEAVVCFEQALVAAGHLPDSRASVEQAIDLRMDLRNSLQPLGELARGLDYLRQAESLAERLDDQRRLGRVSGYMASYFWLMGDHDGAIESGRRALAVAEALRDSALRVATNFRLGRAYHSRGDYRQAMDFFRRNVASLEGDLIRERFAQPFLPSVDSRASLVRCLAELGEFAEGIGIGEEGIRIAEAADHPFSLTVSCYGVGHLYLRKGDPPMAIAALERGLGVCQAWHIPFLLPWIASALGSAYALSGRIGEALPLLAQAVEQAASMAIMADHSLRISRLSEAHLRTGRTDRAMELGGRALDLSRERKERGHEAWALRLLGEIASRGDPPEAAAAKRRYGEALALADELGMRPLVAHCHLGLSELCQRVGKRQEAQEHFTTATTMYREMDMRFWLAQAEAALGPPNGK